MLTIHLNMSQPIIHLLNSCLAGKLCYQLILIWKKNGAEAILHDFHEAKDLSPSQADRAAARHQEILEGAKSNILSAQQKQKEGYDR